MASSMTCTRLTIYTVAAIVLQITGLSLFVLGFFPVKPALSGVSGPESYRSPFCEPAADRNERSLPSDQLRSLYQELSGIAPPFDRLILLVIDGLPAEFIFGKGNQPPSKTLMDAMPYTQTLLANGMAIGYHAKAAPPTVTMPRLKAMVSGAVGGFLDVAFNFNTQAFLDDNLLGQLLSIGWKMVMLGDETWLKLFPGLFSRHDGVSSFYVKDTVEVDHNVSRHLSNELNRDDWSLLILHYLGLDHVGHVGGRNSDLMVPKLDEMDQVIEIIHSDIIQHQENDQRQTLLVVVSDHGMTENGNHGGSSFEETDSLALVVGPKINFSSSASFVDNTVHQVDIAPTLALLFGVPIPKNNVGVLIADIFSSLEESQQLRALELNSWQLLRLLKAQIPDLSCGDPLCDPLSFGQESRIGNCSGSAENMFCCLYCNAAVLHSFWKSKEVSRSSSKDDFYGTTTAYYDFLRTASEWLSRKVTDKPVEQLAFGVAAMCLSCLMLLSLLFCLCREYYLAEKQCLSDWKVGMHCWHLDETFVLAVIFILIVSMGSSSMIEEEHYIWHFLTSTYYLVLLRRTLQFLSAGTVSSLINMIKEQKRSSYFQLCSIALLLVSGRILRGWHQGGVNWTHLQDVSKWLEQAGCGYVKLIQLVSGILLISLSLFSLSSLRLNKNFVLVLGFIYLMCGLLEFLHIAKYQEHILGASNNTATLMAQIIYVVLAIYTVGTLLASPWLLPLRISEGGSGHKTMSVAVSTVVEDKSHLVGLRNSTYVIGWAYISCWCLLQLLLQKPINSMPLLLLFVQILASMHYYSSSGPRHKEWVQVAALYYLGMAGHFSLGNSNTLATIDVAGAFIGISSHSTLFSGILMFMITYASPILVLFGTVMYSSVKDTSYLVTAQNAGSGYLLKMTISFPCLVPLGLNSVLLTAYTILLLLMSNHLFIWSVFSPKYLYVCAATVCVYVGVCIVAATGVYIHFVFRLRRKMEKGSVGNNINKMDFLQSN